MDASGKLRTLAAMAPTMGWSIHDLPPRGPGSRASRMSRGRPLGGYVEHTQPFQDSRGQWYRKMKGTIRRCEAPQEK